MNVSLPAPKDDISIMVQIATDSLRKKKGMAQHIVVVHFCEIYGYIELCCEYTQPVEYTKEFIFGPGKLYFL